MKLRKLIVAVAAMAAAVALAGCPSNVRVYVPGVNGGNGDNGDNGGNGDNGAGNVLLRADPPAGVFVHSAAVPTSITFTIAGANLDLAPGTHIIGGTINDPANLDPVNQGLHASRILAVVGGDGNALGAPAVAATPSNPTVPAVDPFIVAPAAGSLGFGIFTVGANGVGSGVITVELSADGAALAGAASTAVGNIETRTLSFAAGQFGAGSPALAIDLLFMPVAVSFPAASLNLAGRGIESRQPNPTFVRGAGATNQVPANVMFDLPFPDDFDWAAAGYANVTVRFSVTEVLDGESVAIEVFQLGAPAVASPPAAEWAGPFAGTDWGDNNWQLAGAGVGQAQREVTIPLADLTRNGISFRSNRDIGYPRSQDWNFVVSEVRFH